MRKTLVFLVAFTMLLFPLGQSVTAFSDVHSDQHANKINALKEKGIFKGDAKGRFNPKAKMNYAEGVTVIVNALNLDLSDYPNKKLPKASDYFTHVKDKAWYANAFTIAKINGLDIPKNVKPQDHMTREHFAHLLFQAFEVKGPHAYTKMYFPISDAEDVMENYANSIQLLLNAKIISLDKDFYFKPKEKITRSEAAAWIYNAMEFLRMKEEIKQPKPQPEVPMKLQSQAVSKEVNEVTVTAEMPHSGYGLKISSIVFKGDQAIIYTEVVLPDEDKFYTQVITEVSATTYISSAYKPVLANQTNHK